MVPVPGQVTPQPLAPGLVPQNRASGGFNMAKAPNLYAPWQERSEARSLIRGPILSAVPGRTDHLYGRVASGSYVLPAQHVASMGQGNSIAGLAVAHSLFGPNGPYGTPALRIAHGRGAPRPPRIMGSRAAGGSADDGGKLVDCNLAGGEYVIEPEVVRNIGKGSLKNGHRILDAYVMHARKKDIQTIKNLPGPAKD
jgi:hypothetical protein